MDRKDINTLYGGYKSEVQVGGASKQPSVEKVQTKNNTYTPKDSDENTTTSLSKVFKANRELNSEIKQLKKQVSKLQKQLETEQAKNVKLSKRLNLI